MIAYMTKRREELARNPNSAGTATLPQYQTDVTMADVLRIERMSRNNVAFWDISKKTGISKQRVAAILEAAS